MSKKNLNQELLSADSSVEQPMDQGVGLSPEEMLEKVQSKEREFNTARIMNQNKDEEFRIKMLRAVFDALKQLGIDPGDQLQVRQFIEKLRQSNPDLAELFEELMESLLSGEEPQPQEPGQEMPQMPPGMPQAGPEVPQAGQIENIINNINENQSNNEEVQQVL
jgi:hypothetical protein